MRGYVYLDYDGFLHRKTEEYIKTENPLFWADNLDLVVKYWLFDTEDLGNMRNMLIQMRDLQLKNHAVQDFLSEIGFSLSQLKNNDNSVQFKQD